MTDTHPGIEEAPTPNVPHYYPPGFTYQQLVTQGPETDSVTLDQWETFRNGLEANEGYEALEAWRIESANAWHDRQKAEDPDIIEEPELPSYVWALLKTQHFPAHIGKPESGKYDYSEWGFIVFRTAGYGKITRGGTDWERAKDRWDEAIDKGFDDDLAKGAIDAKQARKQFRLQIVEGREWDGASTERCAERYREMCDNGELSIGLQHNLFLVIDERSIDILLTAPRVYDGHFRARKKVPIVLAVSRSVGLGSSKEVDDGEEEEDCWDGTFNVALEFVVGSLFPDIATDMLTPREWGERVAKNECCWGAMSFTKRKIEL